MATKPTRQQQLACDHLAEALLLIATAARLDGRTTLDRDAFAAIAGRLARLTSVFTLDEIVTRALDRRGRALALPPSTAELLTLLATDVEPLAMLLLPDEELRALLEKVQDELGGV